MCHCGEASRRGDVFTETGMTKGLGKTSPEEREAAPRPGGSGGPGLWTRACPASRERAEFQGEAYGGVGVSKG